MKWIPVKVYQVRINWQDAAVTIKRTNGTRERLNVSKARLDRLHTIALLRPAISTHWSGREKVYNL